MLIGEVLSALVNTGDRAIRQIGQARISGRAVVKDLGNGASFAFVITQGPTGCAVPKTLAGKLPVAQFPEIIFIWACGSTVIDKIVSVAKHYGFTDEELDFIINYDQKYPLGQERKGDAED